MRSLLELKIRHSNVVHAIQRGVDSPEDCSYLGKIPQLIESQLMLEEQITQAISDNFPVDHLNEHLALRKRLEDLTENMNYYEKKDFASLLKVLYLSHHYGYDLAHYENMLKRVTNAAI
jgi:hypothetical protein